MKNLHKNIKVLRAVLLLMFALLIAYFVYSIRTYGGRWFNTPYNTRLEKQKDRVIAGSIYDRDKNVLAKSDNDGTRHYIDDKTARLAVSHIVGDSNGITSNGSESFHANYLLGFDQNIISRLVNEFSGEKRKGSDVVLSIDSELTKLAYEKMGSYDGAVVLMNYKTGEILACVSKPGFDPENMKNYVADESGNVAGGNSALVNRATMGRYTPGSVFKIITALAAIENIPDYDTKTWNCDGPLVFDSDSEKYKSDVHFTPEQDKEWRAEQDAIRKGKAKTQNSGDETEIVPEELDSGALISDYKLLRDYQSSYHNETSLKRAFAVSCNHTFAQIALELGESKMQKTTQKLSFNTNFLFKDIVVYGSSYEKGETQYKSGWSSIGQHRDIVTPIHMALISAAIGNDGVMMEPKLLRTVINSLGQSTNMLKTKEYKKVMSVESASILKEYMRYTTTDGTGSAAAVSGYEVCGKTGTAEISSDKKIGNHAWYTGFINSDDHPLAIAVVLEYAGSGGGKAAPVAGAIFSSAVKRGY